jgi:hypothetical protein
LHVDSRRPYTESVKDRLLGSGKTRQHCKPFWDELYAAAAGKDIQFEWRHWGQSLPERLALQLARDAAKGR